MKRRSFIKSLIAVTAAIQAPSVLSSNKLPDKVLQQLKDNSANMANPKYTRIPKEKVEYRELHEGYVDNTSIWNVQWGADSISIIDVIDRAKV